MILRRERITERIAQASTFPVTLIVAGAGYGKTVALGNYLGQFHGSAVRYDARSSCESLEAFTRGLAAAFEPWVPSLAGSFGAVYQWAARSVDPVGVFAHWFVANLDARERLVAIDGVRLCDGDVSVGAFLSRVVRLAPSVRFIIATRSSADLPLASWLAHGDCALPIGIETLRLSDGETQQIARAIAPEIAADALQLLIERADGSPAITVLALRAIAQDPGFARTLFDAGDLLEEVAGAFFCRLTPGELRMVQDTSVLPEVDAALVSAAGHADAVQLLAGVARKVPHLFDTAGETTRYETAFAISLERRLSALGSEERSSVDVRAAAALEASGRTAEALSRYVRQNDVASILRIVERTGPAALASGDAETLCDAIDALPPALRTASAVVVAIEAVAASRSGRFKEADALFARVATLPASRDVLASTDFEYGLHLLRCSRREAAALLASVAADPAIGGERQACAIAAHAAALALCDRLEEARLGIERALPLAARSSDARAEATVRHRAAIVALAAGDADAAKEHARLSYDAAALHGYYDIAQSALIASYDAAVAVDDDPAERLRILGELRDCAAKRGHLRILAYGLAAAAGIEVERGNDSEAAALEARLRGLDASAFCSSTVEMLLPAQALRASWKGDFDAAYRLLAPSAGVQKTSVDAALRFSEIAVYAAAAGYATEADGALASAVAILSSREHASLSVQRARLFAAFAMLLLGRQAPAHAMLALVEGSGMRLSSRLASLRRVLAGLHDWYAGVRDGAGLPVLLEHLREHGFGGVARLIMHLPLSGDVTGTSLPSTADEGRMLAWPA